MIGEALADRAGLARWEAEVRRRFAPVPWARSAAALLQALDAHGRVAADAMPVSAGDA